MFLPIAVLAALATPAQTSPVDPGVDAPTWWVGIAGGSGAGFRLGTDHLNAELRRTALSRGDPPPNPLADRRLRELPVSLRGFTDFRISPSVSVGADLGILRWNSRPTADFETMLLNKYGVVAVGNRGGPCATLRTGPRVSGRVFIVDILSAEATLATGIWLDVAGASRQKWGWWLRPNAAAVMTITHYIEVQIDVGYVYMPQIDQYRDPLRGVEIEVGAAIGIP